MMFCSIHTLVAWLAAFLFGDGQATLLFAGDAMMHEGQIKAARTAGGDYDFSGCFDAVEPWVKGADYAVVNLETPLGGAPYSGYPCFCAPDSYALELKRAGFDLFLNANNHMLDRRAKGLKRTCAALSEMGIPHIGVYENEQQREAALPMVAHVNGFDIGFLNYTYGTNGFEPTDGVVVDYINREKMHADMELLRRAGAELVCVAVHWGEEYKLLPNRSQRSLADYLLAEGADMVIGGHPHVIQPMEMRTDSAGRNRLVVYSLGNFISDMKTRDTRGGALAEVYISRGQDGVARIDSAAYRLVFTVPGVPGRSNFRLVPAEACDSKLWLQHCKAFVQSARSIFDRNNVAVPEKK